MGAFILSVWLQVVEVWSSGIRLVSYPELEQQGPAVVAFVAWRHPPQSWETADFFVSLLYDATYPSDRTRHLKRWADSVGLSFSTWSGPEGAAMLVEAPWPLKAQAMHWLYEVVASLKSGDAHLYGWALQVYRRRRAGLRLGRDISYQLRGWKGQPPTSEALWRYFEQYFRPESLWVGVFGRLTQREKVEWRRLWSGWRLPALESGVSDMPRPVEVPQDTVVENVWAYPIYGAAYLRTPVSWPERIAFVEAFLKRWQEVAPPLQFRGVFEGRDRYRFEVRLDGHSYRYLRQLTHLAARDSLEGQSWAAAYARRRLRLRGDAGSYPDVWIGALLRGDTVALPDTLPAGLWQRGWPVQIQGIWLVQEVNGLDTLLEELSPLPPALPVCDTLSEAPLFETLWIPAHRRRHPPLEAWASAMQLNLLRRPQLRWVIIGYYRRRREQEAILRRLHEIRRVLIQRYRLPPQALQVQVRPAFSDIPPQAIRVVCSGS